MSTPMQDWVAVSEALLHSLLPKGAGLEIFGVGMAPERFAALVDREGARVDHALIAMATATGEAEVRAIFEQLDGDTLIVMFSRWAHYTQAWRSLTHQAEAPHWLPADRGSWWRSVFLAMTGENWWSTDAARQLWPAQF